MTPSKKACPCGGSHSGSNLGSSPQDPALSYAQCCEPLHNGTPAETAEHLMRSRYSAYALNKFEYLITTHYPRHRPSELEASLSNTFRHTQWLGLNILDVQRGTRKDDSGIVAFIARFRDQNGDGSLYERSIFKHDGDRWFYVNGRDQPERNEPCYCGSGRKYKKCHG